MIPEDLKEYIEAVIIPRYDGFDSGHSRGHVHAVINQAIEFCRYYDVNQSMVYTAAAYHDTGLVEDRKIHHLVSGRIVREDGALRKWFSEDQIEIIAQAAEDHRASSDQEPRTIYGKIIAEADRQIVPEIVLKRAIQYGLRHYPELDKERHWTRALEHLQAKYAEGGYLKLWIPESSNSQRIEELRKMIKDEQGLRTLFERIYGEETRVTRKTRS